MKVKIKEKGLLGENCCFHVIVLGNKGRKEEIFEKGRRLRNALIGLKRIGFHVYRGLPFKGENPHYFFAFFFPSKKIEIVRSAIMEAAEGEGLEVEF